MGGRCASSVHVKKQQRQQQQSIMSKETFSPDSTALVLIEYQNEFTTKGGKLHGDVKPVMDASNMLQNSADLVTAAREKGIKILHVGITFADGHPEISKNPYGILAGVKAGEAFKASEWGGEFCDVVKPDMAKGDIVIQGKRGLCGFASTNLDFVLRQNGINDCPGRISHQLLRRVNDAHWVRAWIQSRHADKLHRRHKRRSAGGCRQAQLPHVLAANDAHRFLGQHRLIIPC